MNTNKKTSLKTVFSVIILISIILLAIYSIALHEVEAAKVIVEITRSEPFAASGFNDSEKDELIGDVSLHKINMRKLAVPDGNDMQMPGISATLSDDEGYVLGEWISIGIKEKGVYELDIGLTRPVMKGERIRVAVYVNDEKGNVVVGKKKTVVWE
jgi:hypothetical protein